MVASFMNSIDTFANITVSGWQTNVVWYTNVIWWTDVAFVGAIGFELCKWITYTVNFYFYLLFCYLRIVPNYWSYLLHFMRASEDDFSTWNPVSVLANWHENVPECPTATSDIFTRMITFWVCVVYVSNENLRYR